MISDFIWNVNPVIFQYGTLQLRWFTMLLIAGILLGRYFMLKKLRKADIKPADANIIFYSTLIGAAIVSRLFYFLLNEPRMFKISLVRVFIPLNWKQGFRLDGAFEFSTIGFLIGLILILLLFSKAKKISFNKLVFGGLIFFSVMTVLISFGNLMESENYGAQTDFATGIQFVNKIENKILKTPCCIMRLPNGKNPLDSVDLRKGTTLAHQDIGYRPLLIYAFFSRGATEQLVNEFLIGDIKGTLYDLHDLVYESGEEPLHYTIFQEDNDLYTARIQTIAVARHPVQLYEVVLFTFISVFLLIGTRKNKEGNMLNKIIYAVIIFSLAMFSIGFIQLYKGLMLFKTGISLDQFLWILVIAISLIILVKKKS